MVATFTLPVFTLPAICDQLVLMLNLCGFCVATHACHVRLLTY